MLEEQSKDTGCGLDAAKSEMNLVRSRSGFQVKGQPFLLLLLITSFVTPIALLLPLNGLPFADHPSCLDHCIRHLLGVCTFGSADDSEL